MDGDLHPWERFRQWIHSVCVVTFDLELGQALEVIYPGDAQLSSVEKTNICYLAFPDSNSGSSRDVNFHFRIRRSTLEMADCQRVLLEEAASGMPLDAAYLYGFVHFRQQKDPSIHRGYYQKSLVLLSVLPFFNLWATVIEKVALGFFDSGEPAIEAACHDIDQWPQPITGELLSLPIMGTVIHTRIPTRGDVPFSHKQVLLERKTHQLTNTILLPSIFEVDIYRSLSSVISHVQLLWELVLIGEPLLVIAPTPSRCSALVQSLVSLISPLRPLCDFRPFFTIHDSEFKEYSAKTRTPPRVILGVTNPFFIKALDHWPHILKVGEQTENDGGTEKHQEKARKHWDGRTLDTKPGLYSHYKPFLQKDKSLSKKLFKTDRPDEIQSSLIRRHFLELSQSFMIPLERYLSSLMPLKKQMSPFKSIPNARPFSLDDFLFTIEDAGPSLTCGVKGDWSGLYRRFVSSSTFAGWLSARNSDVAKQLRAAYVEELCQADLSASVLSTKHHVEIVDLVLRMRQRAAELSIGNEQRNRLARQIATVLSHVDEELKSVLMSNCALRDVLL